MIDVNLGRLTASGVNDGLRLCNCRLSGGEVMGDIVGRGIGADDPWIGVDDVSKKSSFIFLPAWYFSLGSSLGFSPLRLFVSSGLLLPESSSSVLLVSSIPPFPSSPFGFFVFVS